MLVGVKDVDVVSIDEEVDDGDDDALAVGAVDEEDGGFGGGHGGLALVLAMLFESQPSLAHTLQISLICYLGLQPRLILGRELLE